MPGTTLKGEEFSRTVSSGQQTPPPFCRNHEGRADRRAEGRRAGTGMEGSNGKMSVDGN